MREFVIISLFGSFRFVFLEMSLWPQKLDWPAEHINPFLSPGQSRQNITVFLFFLPLFLFRPTTSFVIHFLFSPSACLAKCNDPRNSFLYSLQRENSGNFPNRWREYNSFFCMQPSPCLSRCRYKRILYERKSFWLLRGCCVLESHQLRRQKESITVYNRSRIKSARNQPAVNNPQ